MKILHTTLLKIPKPGVLTLIIRIDGIWYELKDNGEGELLSPKSNAPYATLCYFTGKVAVTTEKGPDVGSLCLFNLGE